MQEFWSRVYHVIVTTEHLLILPIVSFYGVPSPFRDGEHRAGCLGTVHPA